MSEHKLRKIIEHNNRLKEQLELPRIPVSQASEALISYTQSTKDYLLPSIWGPPPHDPFASQAGGGCGCSVIRYVKHATLIESCFPSEKSAETAPNSNELSYLLYYVQSKPAKLTKVGAYLSKRAAKDVQRRRRSDVYVALRVYDALLSACAHDLNFFAKDVLGTLDVALSVDDIGYTEVATHTFALFCRCHTGLTLAIDKDLSALYSRLISTFAAQAQASYTTQQDSAMKRVDFALRAIQAIAESQATYASDAGHELPRIVNAVLGRIASAPASMFPIPSTSDQAAEAQLDDEQLGRCAWRCLETLVRRSHGQHSRTIVAEIFNYLDSVQKWQPVELCVQVVTSVIGQLQSQDQNMVIVETLALLADGTLSPHAAAIDTATTTTTKEQAVALPQNVASSKIANRRACIIRILENLFCQPYILVGISVMEALSVLVAFLLQFIKDEPLLKPDHSLFASTLATTSATTESEETPLLAQSKALDQVGPVSDHYHLLAAIGGLAKHQYYSDQLADMAGYLISQLRLDVPVSQDDDQGCGRQLWLLQALTMVLHNSDEGKLGLRQPGSLSLEVFAPLFTLVTHERADLSAQTADCITGILRYNGRGNAVENTWTSAQRQGLDGPIYQKLGGYLLCSHRRELAHRSAGYAGAVAILRELLSPPCTASIQHTLALVDECRPERCSASWVTLLAMLELGPPVVTTSRIDAYGQPVSSEICALLDSIDETEFLASTINGDQTETRNSPSICTPVVSHFD
ncbi:plasma membrane localization protein [Coemansia sp. BCRC 34301]|nr:plasma membrane localization protein [Coemansia sp. BCRC 34301]